MTAAKAVYQAYSQNQSMILVLSPSMRQSAAFLGKSSGFVRKLGIRVRGDGENSHSVLLPNESRIVGLPGNEDTVRGFSGVSLLLIDEAARVPDELCRRTRGRPPQARGLALQHCLRLRAFSAATATERLSQVS